MLEGEGLTNTMVRPIYSMSFQAMRDVKTLQLFYVALHSKTNYSTNLVPLWYGSQVTKILTLRVAPFFRCFDESDPGNRNQLQASMRRTVNEVTTNA